MKERWPIWKDCKHPLATCARGMCEKIGPILPHAPAHTTEQLFKDKHISTKMSVDAYKHNQTVPSAKNYKQFKQAIGLS